ncbi:GTP-binding protein [Methylocaldum sp. RMAD-M]|jgi:G3E family GTPase|uniref:CobW family GTP-binding protein n=1 Tax=Methylocaldum sp. RMAD-M TaxID=2806557 RepID=UPI000A322A36|nr:GTP-binding protein [Methylocaldum sp. RMAD-M]MBP1150843.1 G3E family GTPase [Methylocaldum sp. RMAD-M]
MPLNPNTPLPVIVLTGFLGSGKTTLLNRLLSQAPRTAVLINEFGATPVDQVLIGRQDIPLMTLSGGCLCCQVRGALAPVLRNLRLAWENPNSPRFDRIVIEASGVASPEPVLDTLLRDRWLASRYHLQAVIATVSVPAAEEQLDRFPEARAQVAWADVLVLTHTDRASKNHMTHLAARLDELAPATPRFVAVRGAVDPETVLAAVAPDNRRLPPGQELPDHGFRSVSLYLSAPIPWPRLQTVLEDLLAQHRSRLVRVKGVVRLSDRSEPVIVQAATGRLYPPVALPERASDDRLGRLVFIAVGAVHELAEELMAAVGGIAVPDAIRLH